MKTEKFSERLRIAIDEQKVTATQVGRECGISKGTMSQYLSGRYVAKSERIEKLARVLNCNPKWLEGYDVAMHALKTEDKPSYTLDVFSYVCADGTGEISGNRTAPPEFCDGRHFYLMSDGLNIGWPDGNELLLCRRQGMLRSGQAGIFLDENGDMRVMRYEQRRDAVCLVELGGKGQVFINEEADFFHIAARIMLSLREW